MSKTTQITVDGVNYWLEAVDTESGSDGMRGVLLRGRETTKRPSDYPMMLATVGRKGLFRYRGVAGPWKTTNNGRMLKLRNVNRTPVPVPPPPPPPPTPPSSMTANVGGEAICVRRTDKGFIISGTNGDTILNVLPNQCGPGAIVALNSHKTCLAQTFGVSQS